MSKLKKKEIAMTEYEFIMSQCRKYHFTTWDVDVLEKCKALLKNLTREDLVRVYRSTLLVDRDPLKKEAFNVLFADKIGKREQRIKEMPTDRLIVEFRDKTSGNVSLARKELRERYKTGRDRELIMPAFNMSTKSDQQWLKWQIRNERYGNKRY